MTATTVTSERNGSLADRLELEVPRDAAEVVSIGLGALLFAVLGAAMEWKPGYVALAAIAFALATWLSRSLGRALASLLGAFGLTAGLMVVVASIAPGVTGSLGVGWGLMFVALWLVVLVLAVLFRLSGAKADFGLPLAAGCAASLVIAVFVAAKLNFSANLLFYIVSNEDNAAWVGLATQNHAASSIANQFVGSTLGPVMPLLLGALAGAQKASVPTTNAVFAAYTLAIVLSPLAVASLMGSWTSRSRTAAVAFLAVAFAWAYLAPAYLYKDFGHLSTIWAFLALLVAGAFVTLEGRGAWTLLVGLGVLLFLAGAWFPIAPLGALLAAGLCLAMVRQKSRGSQVAVGLALAAVAILVLLQLDRAGIAIGTDLGALRGSVRGLFESPGGVAQLEPLVLALALAGLVALGTRVRSGDDQVGRMFWFLLTLFAYILLVYAASELLSTGGDSYGLKKVTFVLTLAAIVSLVAFLPRLVADGPTLAALGVALALGSFVFGGAGLLLQRTWPGDGTFPSWLQGAEKVASDRSPNGPRPIVCFSTNNMLSYQCTRWAGALTAAGDGTFLDYRLKIVNGDTAQAADTAREMRRAGVLEGSDVILIDRPSRDTPWGQVLANGGGRVYSVDGSLIKDRTAP